MVSLDPNRRPAWCVESARPFSLRPSIDYVMTDRHCHFKLRGGKITWVHNQRRIR
jgi:hypothetical protein